MTTQALTFASPDEPRQKILFESEVSGVHINYGTVFLKKGTRIPEKGFTQRSQHEISYMQSGKIQMLNADASKGAVLKTGDVVSIETFEPQAGLVLEDSKIIYILIG